MVYWPSSRWSIHNYYWPLTYAFNIIPMNIYVGVELEYVSSVRVYVCVQICICIQNEVKCSYRLEAVKILIIWINSLWWVFLWPESIIYKSNNLLTTKHTDIMCISMILQAMPAVTCVSRWSYKLCLVGACVSRRSYNICLVGFCVSRWSYKLCLVRVCVSRWSYKLCLLVLVYIDDLTIYVW